mgnify:CR=1 FL=1
MNPIVESAGIQVTSTIDLLGNRLVDAFSYSSVDLISPADTDREIEAEIQTGITNVIDSETVGSSMPTTETLEPPSEGAQMEVLMLSLIHI